MGSTQKQLQMQQTTTLHFEERELAAAAVVHDYIFLNKLKKIKNNRLRKNVRSEKNKAISLKESTSHIFAFLPTVFNIGDCRL